MKTVCGWCGKHMNGDSNAEVVSHGMCEPCAVAFEEEAEKSCFGHFLRDAADTDIKPLLADLQSRRAVDETTPIITTPPPVRGRVGLEAS